jgi:hypothetical protein
MDFGPEEGGGDTSSLVERDQRSLAQRGGGLGALGSSEATKVRGCRAERPGAEDEEVQPRHGGAGGWQSGAEEPVGKWKQWAWRAEAGL